MPADTRAGGLWHFPVCVEIGDAKAADRVPRKKDGTESPGLRRLRDSQPGYEQGFVVRDPDGNWLLLSRRLK
jgi:hypothetical protein